MAYAASASTEAPMITMAMYQITEGSSTEAVLAADASLGAACHPAPAVPPVRAVAVSGDNVRGASTGSIRAAGEDCCTDSTILSQSRELPPQSLVLETDFLDLPRLNGKSEDSDRGRGAKDEDEKHDRLNIQTLSSLCCELRGSRPPSVQ